MTDDLLRDLPGANPRVSISLIKPADELSLRFAVSFYDDLEEVREGTLLKYLDLIREKIESVKGLRFEASGLQIALGDRKKSIRRRRSEYTSHAHFSIFAEIGQDISTFDAVRELLDGLELESASEMTKLFDGPVNLVLKRPDQYRSELLKAIFADFNLLKEGLGPEFEILPVGLGGRVQVRAHSDTEVELWIEYSHSIRSVRDREFETTKLLLRQH